MQFRPAREQAKEFRNVADLDAMLAEPVAFILHGKRRLIKPISSEQFLRFTQAYNEFAGLDKKEDITADTVIDSFHRCVSQVCEDVSRQDVADMTQMQFGALFNLICETISGKIFEPANDDELKKKMRRPDHSSFQQANS